MRRLPVIALVWFATISLSKGGAVAPSGLSGTAISSSQIRLTWADNSTNETGFKIERSINAAPFTQIAMAGADITKFTNTGLTSSTSYSYRVRAYNAYGNSTYSNAVVVKTLASSPTPTPSATPTPAPTATPAPTPPPPTVSILNDSGAVVVTYDASTADKFDAVMAALQSRTNVKVRLSEGVFRTNIAAHLWFPRAYWEIEGAGIDRTEIRAIGNLSTPNNWVVIGNDDGDLSKHADGVYLHDFTVNGNWPVIGTTASTLNGEKCGKITLISLLGSNTTIERVRGIHQYGSRANHNESFGFRLAGGSASNTQVGGCVIRSCIVELPAGNYDSPYALHGANNAHPMTLSQVHDCAAYGVNDGLGWIDAGNGTTAFIGGGVNIARVEQCRIYNNTFVDCMTILQHNIGIARDISIHDNSAVRAATGGLSSNNSSHWRLYNNTIQLQRRNGNAANYGMVFGGICSNLYIGYNNISTTTGGRGTGGFWGLALSSLNGATIKYNTIDGVDYNGWHGTNVIVVGNRTSTGGILPYLDANANGLLDNSPTPSATPTPTPAPTAAPTPTATAQPSPTSTPTPTPTPTPRPATSISVTLQWDPPADTTNVASYNVWWGTEILDPATGGTTVKMTNKRNILAPTTKVTISLPDLTERYFTVTAVGVNGQESLPSNRIGYPTPSP
jgi:hypothetical protein